MNPKRDFMPQRLLPFPFSYPKHTINAISALDTKLLLSTNSTMHCSARLLYHNLTPIKQQPLAPCARISPSSGSNPNPILRRDFASSSLLLLLITPNTSPLRAETISPNCADPAPTKQAFIDVSVDGEAIGRIVIGLYGDTVPAGAARAGKENGRELAVDRLVEEWERQNENCNGTKNVARSVSIIVRDPSKPPPKLKLVARKGKLEIDQEEVGMDPNGTEFVITTKDSPELDGSALVVGTVLQGMDVVDRISRVKTVQENSTSPYFRVAKLIGDKRAVVAERGFNRPYSKVAITNCGLIG
ncbi:UNVERIFIED_CONTAM: Peptidyl-prolyl cis-trans isomerase CYP26-2, chloroplastic [Sesamum radiatum]|uniref:Peptidyl-prolyl cis-trans isomerase CYP26-2, chloroplastic n=1 Tax=Sesamum radiatum TaxID=300843 RepID=A0AAW2PJM1_SESRA